MDRRDFLRLSASAGGLTLAVSVAACRNDGPAPTGDALFAPDAWIRIAGDGTVTVVLARTEMGQGVSTALPMLIAEELDCEWGTLKVEQAPAHEAYGNTALQANVMSTGGSSAVREAWDPLRRAGASARHLLVAAAAMRWGVEPSSCRTEAGRVIHRNGESLGYGELAAAASLLPVPRDVPLKSPAEWRLIGKPVARRDALEVATGRANFGIDVRRPGMLYASVVRAPVWGGKVRRVDETAARAAPGVEDVVVLRDRVAVVADTYWHALKGRERLVVEWDDGPLVELDDEAIGARLRAIADAGEGGVARDNGDVGAVDGGTVIDAEFEVPFLAHATMEPMNCTVDPTTGEAWVSTQFQDAPALINGGGARGRLASGLGRGPNHAKVHTTRVGGGFGRRLQVDYVTEATAIARAVGVPVQVTWTREDDMRHDYYRPRALHRVRATIDDAGRLVAWRHQVVAPSITRGFVPRVVPDILATMAGPIKGGVDGSTVEGAADIPYRIPNVRITSAMANVGVPVGFWRSVGHSHGAFAVECLVDRVARQLGRDPVEYRRELLSHLPVYRAVLDLAAERAGWGSPLPDGHARGVAFHESFGSRVAQVAEVSIAGKEVRVHRVTCAVDCGVVVNPDIARAQIEGGILFGLSAALYSEINIDGGRVRQSNFGDYRVLRFPEAPEIEVHFVDRPNSAPGGIGEVGTPPIAPAIANAVFALTGVSPSKLPMRV